MGHPEQIGVATILPREATEDALTARSAIDFHGGVSLTVTVQFPVDGPLSSRMGQFAKIARNGLRDMADMDTFPAVPKVMYPV